ncbi:MAG: PEGA domain-containing protein [Myxococcota bacterium]
MPAIAWKRWCVTLLGLSVSTALASPAMAGESDVSTVVLPISTEGELSQVALDRIDASLRKGLTSGGLSIVDGGGTSPCADAQCVADRATQAEANTAVQLQLVLEGRDYRIELLATDRDGKPLTASAECAICGFDEAATVVGDEATILAGKLTEGPEPAQVTVDTTPAGAAVYLDDEPVGTSPLSIDVTEGEHEIRLEKEGFGTKRATYSAVGGVKEKLSYEMVAQTAPSKSMRTGGWAAVGAGAAAFIAGVGSLAINGRDVPWRCDDPVNIDANGICRYQFTSVPVGATLLALGSASVAAGTVWLLVDRNRRRADAKQVRIIPTGLGIAGRF